MTAMRKRIRARDVPWAMASSAGSFRKAGMRSTSLHDTNRPAARGQEHSKRLAQYGGVKAPASRVTIRSSSHPDGQGGERRLQKTTGVCFFNASCIFALAKTTLPRSLQKQPHCQQLGLLSPLALNGEKADGCKRCVLQVMPSVTRCQAPLAMPCARNSVEAQANQASPKICRTAKDADSGVTECPPLSPLQRKTSTARAWLGAWRGA